MNNLIKCSKLVDYSSDDEQCDETENEAPVLTLELENKIDFGHRKHEILPLPSEIKQMFPDTESSEVFEDPRDHSGKIRCFPHERGIWATYVFIDYEAKPEFLEFVEALKSVVQKHGILLDSIEDYHVSLSRTVKLRHHWIMPFVESLKTHVRHHFRFKIMFESLEVYENEEKTRTFLGLKVHYGYDNLCKILRNVDKSLDEFKLPVFYENPSFHLSCASSVGNNAEQIELLLPDLNAIFQTFIDKYPEYRTLWVSKVLCKSGNKYFAVPLRT